MKIGQNTRRILGASLAGLSLACAPAVHQFRGEYAPSEPVSPALLAELSDSLDAYSLRLQKTKDSCIVILDTLTSDPTQPTPALESLLHPEYRLRTLNRVRNILSSYSKFPLNPLDRHNAEITMEQFIKSGDYSNVGNTLSDLERSRQSSTWYTYADILESSFPKKN